MSLASATVLLVGASLRNAARRQVRRLRQPRYLVASLAGLFYFWTFFLRRAATGQGGRLEPRHLPLVAVGLGATALFTVFATWVFGDEEGALSFTEAEVQFLFPAPATRRALIVYKLVRAGLMALLSAVLMTVFFGRRVSSTPLFFCLGTWVALSTLTAHLSAASLARASLVEHGITGLRRRLLTVAVLAGVFGALAWWTLQARPSMPLDSFDGFSAWATDTADTAPLSWLFAPVRAPIAVMLATTFGEFVRALPAALLVLGLHVAWVLSSDRAFEEASVAASEKRTKVLEQARSGTYRLRRTRPLFRLAGQGRPELGIFWKNLLSMTRVVSPRFVAALLVVVVAFVVFMVSTGVTARDSVAPLGLVCAAVAIATVVFGPASVRADFRDDLAHLELLRTWPISSRALVLGELAAPTVVLACLEWLLLAGALVFSSSLHDRTFPRESHLPLVLALALVLPALTLGGLVVQNLGALLFPGWVAAGRRQVRGIEATGQRMLTLVANVLVLTLGALPAAIAGGLPVALLWSPLGFAALPPGALVAAFVLLVEAWVASGLLGKAFERLDLSRE